MKRRRPRVYKPLPDGYVSMAQTAALLNVSRQAVERRIRTGRLQAIPHGGGPDRPAMWLLRREEVLRHARAREDRMEQRLRAMRAALDAH